MSAKTRSPLKDKPLRNPGQSSDERLDELLHERFAQPFLLAGLFIILTLLEWWRWYSAMPPVPLIFSMVALALITYAAIKIFRAIPEIRRLKQGRDGERAVGQFLERLRESGYQVFHDVVGTNFNIDHVLIGPAGVFAIETKTYSKPVRGQPKLEFDGESIRINGAELTRDPVIQAKAQAGWLRQVLTESTKKSIRVRPVILFPGWFVERKPGSTKDVWVLEPKALPGFLEHEPAVLPNEDIGLASYHLSRHIRTSTNA